MSKKIVLTGGGTAGHVTPNLALIPKLLEEGYEIEYIGSKAGMERQLMEEADIKYHPISCGKLRREITYKNLTDVFRVVKGINQAKKLLKEINPDIIFSKGGFVAVPVVIAAKSLKIPIVAHESDLTPGIATKITIPRAQRICCSFEKTLEYLPQEKSIHTGLPIRAELKNGNILEAKKICNFKNNKPVILIIGGSLGALRINNVIHDNIDTLALEYNVIHICGKGKMKDQITHENYRQFEYLKSDLPHILSYADIVISRAGANAINELLFLKKLNILIPLTKAASRGDQILNANEFVQKGYSYKLDEEALSIESLMHAITAVLANSDSYLENMKEDLKIDPIKMIFEVIDEELKKSEELKEEIKENIEDEGL